jgi:hypothetical protein
VNLASRFAFPAALVYLWVMMILLGAIVLESFMLYPNIFHDPPASLARSMAFLAVSGPSDFFPPLGFLSWVAGAAALALTWRDAPARRWLLLSLGAVVAEGVVSILFFWPRNEMMFVEGTAVHSVEVLRQTAREFVALHWLRLGFNVVASAAALAGCLAAYRSRIIAPAAAGVEPPPPPSARGRGAEAAA